MYDYDFLEGATPSCLRLVFVVVPAQSITNCFPHRRLEDKMRSHPIKMYLAILLLGLIDFSRKDPALPNNHKFSDVPNFFQIKVKASTTTYCICDNSRFLF